MDVPILVVDDQPANLVAMGAAIAESGIDIVSAASGAPALRCLIELASAATSFVVLLTKFVERRQSTPVAEKVLRVFARPFTVGAVQVCRPLSESPSIPTTATTACRS